MTPSLPAAQMVLDLAQDSGLTPSFFAVVQVLKDHHGLSFDAPVVLSGREGMEQKDVSTSLRQAIWTLALHPHMDSGEVAWHFYRGDTARALSSLDPAFFHSSDSRKTLAWMLERDSNLPSDADQRQSWRLRERDEWLVAALDNQVPGFFQGPEAAGHFRSLLLLDTPRALAAFARARPDCWTMAGEDRKLVMKSVAPRLSSNVWDVLLERGQNPEALLPSGEPLWRALLPRKPGPPLHQTTLHARIESWLLQRVQEKRPPEGGQAYLSAAAMATVFPAVENKRKGRKKEAELLEILPGEWVWQSPTGSGLPAFMRLLRNRGRDASDADNDWWAQQLLDRPRWRAALGTKGEFCLKAYLLIRADNDKALKALLRKTEPAIANDPTVVLFLEELEKVRHLFEPSPARIKRMDLELSLPNAAATAPRPRL